MAVDRHTIVDDIVDGLLEQILSGEMKTDTALPPEAEIAAAAHASRLTAREAIKVLQAHNIVQVRRGIGTFVNPPAQWTSLDAILRGVARGIDAGEIPLRLLEARRIVETGAAELAATRHSAAHLASMQESIDLMVERRDSTEVAAFTEADIAFHDAVLSASGNPFIPALLNSLAPLLYSTRRETSEIPQIREHAIEHHRRILAAIESGDAELSRLAMTEHLAQTFDDYEHYVAVTPSSDRRPGR
jgi:GntR family transcriptional regulator, transcriptional repressor for pyruvate dehydrogenase complex